MATILIVDDLAANREVLATVLRHHRHQVLEAVDGRQALASARHERPDLIITDVLMPVMDGYEFVRHLRQDDHTRATPVVFYTAHYGEPDDRALARAAGVKWILTKPADSLALIDVVDRVLAGQTEPGLGTEAHAQAVSAAFDREHRRLLTDKLSEKTADLIALNTRLRMLTQINLDLASERDCARLLQRVCVAAGDLFSAADATLGVVEPADARTVQCVVARGLEPPAWVAQGDALPAPLTAVVADRQTARGFSAVFGPAAPSYLAAPVASPDVVYGWLCLVGAPGRLFSDEEELLITALAGQVGRIYENIALCASAQQRADDVVREMAERQRVETQSQQAHKMEAIGRLAGGVAHDFNNLLTAILGHCELALTGMDPADPHAADILHIQGAATSAAALTRQLLAFSRQQPIEPTRLELGALVSAMQPMLSRLIGAHVEVALHLAPAPALLLADRGQIDQVIMNLALNARDAMPAGGTLTIGTALVAVDRDVAGAHMPMAPGPYVALTVSDTGTGMTPDVQAHLFEPFFTTKPAGEGTGLGLATVHGIVSRYGGSVQVDTRQGQGTTITVYFPRAAA